MFSDNPTVAAAQKVMLEILKEAHRICVKHGLTYWLDTGTLLGAVRHKGFIPWDDDCDIGMPRADYNKFLEIAPSELSDDFFLQTKKTDPNFRLGFAKIRKNGTIFLERDETGEEKYHHGIYIDIFPFDYYKSARFLSIMRWRRILRNQKRLYPKGSKERAYAHFYTQVIMGIPYQLSNLLRYSVANWSWVRKRFVSDANDANFEWFTYGLECQAADIKTKPQFYMPPVLTKGCFEGEDFYLPNNSKMCLTYVFGKNFMTPPPPKYRFTHAKYIKV